ncbi:hypothetical protein KBB05_02185 [Patescibacteria group bacterium]|nr:hypothetical protein [Patescibacteria group bacterium]
MGHFYHKEYSQLDEAYHHINHYGKNKPHHTKDHMMNEEELLFHYAEVTRLGKEIGKVPIKLHQQFIDNLKRYHCKYLAVVSS